ncbi:hypothetical protein LTR50_007408 [Elasticomyces elasticus]|nr:hypothetical protein LTR50_007408 [Elasticomyces elasticus]
MTSDGPYYQSLPVGYQQGNDEFPQAIDKAESNTPAPTASVYPEPLPVGTDYAQLDPLMAGLIEAANAAQAQQSPGTEVPAGEYNGQAQAEAALATMRRKSKRKRDKSADTDGIAEDATAAPKRQKRNSRGSAVVDITDNDDIQVTSTTNTAQESPNALGARSAGVHSAAALFREPSANSKKYTRPPMSKLFASLQLSPERFLYLQAAAKQYMLDPEHPERQDCVGSRGRGDSDMVKLKLYQCVRSFLEDEDMGLKYFGADAEVEPNAQTDGTINYNDTPARKWTWPRDGDKIIALCTPLLRRMVTNERQRKYAVESRKGDKNKDGTDGQADVRTNANDEGLSHNSSAPFNKGEVCLECSYNICTNSDHQQSTTQPIDLNPALEHGLVQIYLARDHNTVVDTIMQNAPGPGSPDIQAFPKFRVNVLTSDGLVPVNGPDTWQLAREDVQRTVWLDNIVKVVVDWT